MANDARSASRRDKIPSDTSKQTEANAHAHALDIESGRGKKYAKGGKKKRYSRAILFRFMHLSRRSE